MKRIIVLLVVCLLLPVISFSDSLDKIDFYDAYTHVEISKDGYPLVATIYLSEDHMLFYTFQDFNPSASLRSCSYIGEWEYTSDNEIKAKIGPLSYIKLHITVTFNISLVDTETMEVYSPVSVLFR